MDNAQHPDPAHPENGTTASLSWRTKLGRARSALGQRLIGSVLKITENQCALDQYGAQTDDVPPRELGLEGFSSWLVASEHPERNEQTQIGLWVKEPADDTKPVYVLFHGRNGHWGYCGDARLPPPEGFDPHYRIHWIKAMAEEGAGIIAVHTRGFGMSAPGTTALGVELSEPAFRRDMKAIADYALAMRAFAPERIGIVGESFGGAMAAMLAEEMTARGKPPALLGLVNTFDTLPNAAKYYVNNTKLLGWQPGKEMSAEQVAQYMSHRIDTIGRLKRLDPNKTRLYVAHAPDDHRVLFDNAERLVEEASALRLPCQFRRLTGEHLLPGGDLFPHTNWNPATIARDVAAMLRYEAIGSDMPNGYAAGRHNGNAFGR